MPFYPTLTENRTYQQVTDVFRGYNHNLKIDEGEMYDMQNLTSDYFPLLGNRGKRGIVRELTAPGGILAKESIAYVDDGKLYYDGKEVAGLELEPGEKQLVSMGAYLVIWPDKKFLNTKDLTEYGSIDTVFTTTATVTYALCDKDSKELGNVPTEKPQNPTGGQYWMDTSTTPHSLKVYNSAGNVWVSVATVYLKITSTGIGKNFKKYDGVKLSGIAYAGEKAEVKEQYDALNGTHTIQDKGDDYIVIVGIVDETYTQSAGAVTVSRCAPDMDYITEAGNRLWGCKYGIVDGKPINEIYCCALGDFKNWNSFQGISSDSYVASVGTDGKWTGAITHLGYPLFFKENVMHKVFVSSSGAHQINDTACRGVQEGCSKSLSIVGERLYYKSRSGVMMYDGSLPETVSDALGGVKYYDAAAGSVDDKYYISMRDDNQKWSLFVLDAAKGLWHREDGTHAMCFTRAGNELYFIDADTKQIVTVNGTVGAAEPDVEWQATTGIIGYTTVEQKYVSRFNLRMKLPEGSTADMYIQYDSDGFWHHCGHMVGTGTNTFMLPVRPRRCDHFQFRIEGCGDVRVYSFSKIFEPGSDVL